LCWCVAVASGESEAGEFETKRSGKGRAQGVKQEKNQKGRAVASQEGGNPTGGQILVSPRDEGQNKKLTRQGVRKKSTKKDPTPQNG